MEEVKVANVTMSAFSVKGPYLYIIRLKGLATN